jgi:hypothetical protein
MNLIFRTRPLRRPAPWCVMVGIWYYLCRGHNSQWGFSWIQIAIRLCSRQHVHISQKSSCQHLYPLYALYYCVVSTTYVHISRQIIVDAAKKWYQTQKWQEVSTTAPL